MPNVPQDIQPSFKFNDDVPYPGVMGQRSANITLEDGMPRTRAGYSVYNDALKNAAAQYTEYVPLEDAEGNTFYAIIVGNNIYDSAGTLIHTFATNPYAPGPPMAILAQKNLTVVSDGTGYILLRAVGGLATAIGVMAAPTAAAVTGLNAAGSMTDGLRHIRIRWYDEDTGTYSDPNESPGATSLSQTVAAPNSQISIDITAEVPPARVTHWEVQFSSGTDTPSDYEISVADGMSSSLIPIGTLTALWSLDPATAKSFEFRTNGLITEYRRGRFPANFNFITGWRARAFVARTDNTYLAWSEPGNIEHWYGDESEPELGQFNVTNGEGTITEGNGPCTGLAATEQNLLFFQAGGITMAEGTWEERFSNDGTFVGRNARISGIAVNNMGNVIPRPITVDQEIYFASQDGPKVWTQNQILDLQSKSISQEWRAMLDGSDTNQLIVGWNPDQKQVIYMAAQTGARTTTFPTRALVFQRDQNLWCPPWDLEATSLTLHRLSGSGTRGNTLFIGTPYGTIVRFAGHADGVIAATTDVGEHTPTGNTTTTITKTGAGWAVDAWQGYGLVLEDENGDYEYAMIQSNTADTLTWDGAIAVPTNDWTTFYIGGIPGRLVLQDSVGFNETTMRGLTLVLDDLTERLD